MQTFLPYKSYLMSAQVLDMRRLGKQRVETKQIITAILNPEYGWQHHPAVNMWRGYVNDLALYGRTICREWIARGYKDTLLPFFNDHYDIMEMNSPPWLGDAEFHRSHRSNLLRKDGHHYRQFWPDERNDLEYLWPV